MEKHILLNDVYQKLYQLGIGCTQSMYTDLVIHCEFLDAGFSTGKKTINYDAEAFFNETNQTIYLWEMTKEQGHGFSFGTDSDSTFQSGKTLYRKVKSIQYAPDGKAYEYTLDLGAIPKAFKETASTYGWKLKSVISQDKARYPKDFIPMIQPGHFKVTPESLMNTSDRQVQQNQYQQGQYQQNQYQQSQNQQNQYQQNQYQQGQYQQGQNQQNQYQQSQNQQAQNQMGQINPVRQPQMNQSWQPEPPQNNRKGFPFWISLIPVVVITLALFLYAEVTVFGYAAAGVLLLILFLLSKRLRKLGCFAQLLIWIASLILLFLIFSFSLPA